MTDNEAKGPCPFCKKSHEYSQRECIKRSSKAFIDRLIESGKRWEIPPGETMSPAGRAELRRDMEQVDRQTRELIHPTQPAPTDAQRVATTRNVRDLLREANAALEKVDPAGISETGVEAYKTLAIRGASRQQSWLDRSRDALRDACAELVETWTCPVSGCGGALVRLKTAQGIITRCASCDYNETHGAT